MEEKGYWSRGLSRRRFLYRSGLLITGLGASQFAACGGSDDKKIAATPSPGGQPETRPVSIGMLFPLTGIAAGFGKAVVDGFQFEFERANSRGIQTAGGT